MIPNFNTMDDLLLDVENNPEQYTNGYTAHIDETNKTVAYMNGQWIEINAEVSENGLSLSLYELNQQIISQLPTYSNEAWQVAKEILNTYLESHKCEYYMLYGKEINYFTVFHKLDTDSNFTNLYDALIECLGAIGKVKSFDATEDGFAIEIWAAPVDNDIATCLYLFPFDEGVVTFNE